MRDNTSAAGATHDGSDASRHVGGIGGLLNAAIDFINSSAALVVLEGRLAVLSMTIMLSTASRPSRTTSAAELLMKSIAAFSKPPMPPTCRLASEPSCVAPAALVLSRISATSLAHRLASQQRGEHQSRGERHAQRCHRMLVHVMPHIGDDVLGYALSAVGCVASLVLRTVGAVPHAFLDLIRAGGHLIHGFMRRGGHFVCGAISGFLNHERVLFVNSCIGLLSWWHPREGTGCELQLAWRACMGIVSRFRA